MEWKSVNVPQGSRLFRNHRFSYMSRGANYSIEIDEQVDGNCSGHAELSNDSSGSIPSVSGKDIKDCLQAVIKKIQEKYG